MACFSSRTSQNGATFIELLIAAAIAMTATVAVSSISNYVGHMGTERRIALRMAGLGKTVQSLVKYGGTCQTALQGVVLTTSANLVQEGTNIGMDQIGSHKIRLNIPGIRSGTSRNQDFIADPYFPGALAQRWDLLYDQEVQITGLQFTRMTMVPGSADAGMTQADFIGILKMRAQGLRASGSNRGVARAREYTLGTILMRVEHGINATNPGAILRCSGTQAQSPQDFCENLGCTWTVAATPQCNCGSVDIGCPPGEVLVSLDILSGRMCRPLGGTCGPNQYSVGAAIGQALCMNSPDCQAPPGTLTWYGNGANVNDFCFNTTALTVPSGVVGTANANSALGFPGTGDGAATFECKGGLFSAPNTIGAGLGCIAAPPPTATPSPTSPGATNTPVPTSTPGGPTDTPTITPTPGGATDTPTPTPTITPTPGGPTDTPTPTPTITPTPPPGSTDTPTPTPTNTPTPTPTPTLPPMACQCVYSYSGMGPCWPLVSPFNLIGSIQLCSDSDWNGNSGCSPASSGCVANFGYCIGSPNSGDPCTGNGDCPGGNCGF